MNKILKLGLKKTLRFALILIILLLAAKFVFAQENSSDYVNRGEFEKSFRSFRDNIADNYASQDDLDHLTKMYYSKLLIEGVVMLCILGFFVSFIYWLKLNKHKFKPKPKKTFYADHREEVIAEAQKIINAQNKEKNIEENSQ